MTTVRFDADQVEAARRQLGSDIVPTFEADGSALFKVPVVNFAAFRSFLFGFLHRVELLEPPEWRAEIVDWLETIEDPLRARSSLALAEVVEQETPDCE